MTQELPSIRRYCRLITGGTTKGQALSMTITRRLPALLFFSLACAAPSWAEAESADPKWVWSAACEDGFCVFRRAIETQGNDTTSALFEVLVNTESGEASMILTLPLGVALEPGVRLIVEGREWVAPLKVCLPDGCRATVDINAADFGLLLQRPVLDIRYIAFGADTAISVKLPISKLVGAMSKPGLSK